ncbi:hypothetical protein B0H11DRAFT_2023680 [Mycena galericulata]|nr:hypothetical protein B0H11DRAFT_2023680 [Mycena galericulata]
MCPPFIQALSTHLLQLDLLRRIPLWIAYAFFSNEPLVVLVYEYLVFQTTAQVFFAVRYFVSFVALWCVFYDLVPKFIIHSCSRLERRLKALPLLRKRLVEVTFYIRVRGIQLRVLLAFLMTAGGVAGSLAMRTTVEYGGP